MKIAKNTVVSVAYKLSDAQGNLIEESDEPMVYLHGGYDGTFPKIEGKWLFSDMFGGSSSPLSLDSSYYYP